jgi:L-asparaginase / beta-aspartyl-peptidase
MKVRRLSNLLFMVKKEEECVSLKSDFGIVIHGGAGSFNPSSKANVLLRKKTLARAASIGFSHLAGSGASALDAIEESIKVLEDSGVFNAGSGASLTLEGKVTADAAVMTGELDCGSVGCVSIAKNPISLARNVMEKSDHVFLVGDQGLAKFAAASGLQLTPLEPSRVRLRLYDKNLSTMKRGLVKAWPRNYKLLKEYLRNNQSSVTSDTVGAVAIDASGKVCAGVSTGGRWLKLPGRVGDSAVIGAGIYADDLAGAASATGAGEEIIKVCLTKTVCDLMRMGADAQGACEAAIDILTSRRGHGIAGVIAVDKFGRFGAARNTEMLQCAFRFSSMKRPYTAVLPQEKYPKQVRISTNLTRLNF